jgi:hypothetical protein
MKRMNVAYLFRLTGGHARKEYARGRLNAFTACGTASRDRGKSDVAIKLTCIKNVQSKAPADLAMLEITPKTKSHVWMPHSRKDFFERLGRVIGCGNVSGLSCGCYGPQAGMEMCGPGADQPREL